MTSAGIASHWLVGLDIGSTSGRATAAAIDADDRLGEGPGLARGADQHGRPQRPHHRRQVARAAPATARAPPPARPARRTRACAGRGSAGRRPAARGCRRWRWRAVSASPASPSSRSARRSRRAMPMPAAPAPRMTDALLTQRRAGEPPAGHDAGDGHRRGPLDVVVEAGQHVAVALQQGEGVHLLEVLPLQQRPGKPAPSPRARTPRPGCRTPARAAAAAASRGTARRSAARGCRSRRPG